MPPFKQIFHLCGTLQIEVCVHMHICFHMSSVCVWLRHTPIKPQKMQAAPGRGYGKKRKNNRIKGVEGGTGEEG